MFMCKRCGYTSKLQCNVKNHLKRQKTCKPVLEDCEPSVTLQNDIPKMNQISNCSHERDKQYNHKQYNQQYH